MLLWFKDSEIDKLQSQTEQQMFGLNELVEDKPALLGFYCNFESEFYFFH